MGMLKCPSSQTYENHFNQYLPVDEEKLRKDGQLTNKNMKYLEMYVKKN